MSSSPVILVTGASSGIGAATARLFAQKGYRVSLAARRIERLQSLADEIQSLGGQALPVATDVSCLEDVKNVVQATLERFGQIDVLFNNAGFGRLNWLENLDAEKDVKAQVLVNILGVIWMSQAVLPHMMERRQGHIINMSSMAGLVATPTYTVYAATKFAVRGFTEALRRDVRIYGIRASGIYPGGVETEFGEIAGYHRTTRVAMPRLLTLSAEAVARSVWGLVRWPRRVHVVPWLMNIGVWSNAGLPWLLDWVMERMFVIPERNRKR
jgi:NADP-dependent 3-hydroxy acid dehydrogenase YdfG